MVAFPPFGWAWAAVPGIALFMWASLNARSGRMAAWVGVVFAIAFIAPLMNWLAAVETVAWIGIIGAHLPLFAILARLTWAVRDWPLPSRVAAVAGGWIGLFLVIRYLPLFALEWADPGYVVAVWEPARASAALWGATGWGAILGLTGTLLAIAATDRRLGVALAGAAVLGVGLAVGFVVDERPTGDTLAVTIVQGHPACPTLPCTSSRADITANHLRMTDELDPGPDLVVWGESSAGFTTDPGQNPAVAEAIAAQTGRLDAHLLIGSDRPAGAVNFVNANLLFDPDGRLVGEYAKQHPVPFGEFVPLRGLIGDIYPFTRQPRDMLRGQGPELLDMDGVALGTVISFEGAFGRYAREHAALGADLLVVNTNEASFGRGAAADQLIGMTRLRAAELGLDVVHAAVSGASTLITDGGVPGPISPLYEEAVIAGDVTLRDAPPTLYARWGDWLVGAILVVAGALVVRRAVLGAAPSTDVDAVDVVLDPPDGGSGMTGIREPLDDVGDGVGGDHGEEAEAHVERAEGIDRRE